MVSEGRKARRSGVCLGTPSQGTNHGIFGAHDQGEFNAQRHGLRRVLGEDGLEQGDNGGALLGRDMRQSIAHPMNATALMGGMEDLRGGRPEPLVIVSNDQLDAPQAPIRQGAQEGFPERFGF
jgi:hypothetical protein